MICRVCLQSDAVPSTLQFDDGEEISMNLCALCIAAFDAEAAIDEIVPV